MFSKLLKKKDNIELFWDWFTKYSDKYFHFETNQDVLFQQLKAQLNRIDVNLVFEFSPIFANGTREFVISADGIKSSFPSVVNLVEKAPNINNWAIIAFRQPRKGITQINYENLVVKFEDVYFRFAKDNGQIALELHIRRFYESAELTGATYILLDNILGEYSTTMDISSIDKKILYEVNIENLFPIQYLPQIITSYKIEFNN